MHDLSLLPQARRLGKIEWFLYALLIGYVFEMTVVVQLGAALRDRRSIEYASLVLGTSALLMVMLLHFIKTISIAVLKQQQDNAFKYVRTFRRRLYVCTYFQFGCFAYCVMLANNTPVLLAPVASLYPIADLAACTHGPAPQMP